MRGHESRPFNWTQSAAARARLSEANRSDSQRPATRPTTGRLRGGSAEVEGQHVLAPHGAAGVGEAVAQVERAGRAGAV